MALFSRHSTSVRALIIAFPSRSIRTQVAASTTRRADARSEISAARNQSSKESSAEKPVTKYRSKHYNPSSKNSLPDGKILLEPHILSARLKKLCDGGQIDTAVALLKNSPLDAQNVPVWNTLIWECLKAERLRLAYELYIDMKRRGHRPNTRTFQTLLNGLARIEDWGSHTKQLANAHSIHQAFVRHVDAVKKHDPSSTELSITPTVAYVKILGAVGLHQEVFDVFYSLDTEGPLAPDHVLLTAMFQALASKPTAETGDFVQNAASAKLLWNLTMKASRRTKFQIDGFLVSSAIVALSRGRPAEQDFAFSLVKEYFGLVAFDGMDEPISSKGKNILPLQPQSFAAILTLCRNSSRPLYAINLFGAVLQRPESQGGSSIIDRVHVEQVLQSLIAVDIPSSSEKALELIEWMLTQEIKLPSAAATRIRPTYSTYNLLISHICRTENNWRVATKAFDLMTGYHCHDFMDGVEAKQPRFDHRSTGKNISPTAEMLSSMMRTAVGSENRANIRQALRLIHHFGIRSLARPSHTLESKKASKEKQFYASKLAQSVLEGIDLLFARSTAQDRMRDDDLVRWKSLKIEAKNLLGHETDHDFIPSIRRKQVKNIREGRGQMSRLSS
ncbi:pentatricopeptide repeat-containing protein [Lentinula aff. detonsa]|uniref:Pentatricopeptide repeat-containing protein n=1 Tax=Lentinula aff. detonsa TaxID=2804958 RepID=A0AA38L0L1_9AGAR|nr:pentatricopeptide repeat-containing protein [Lentinula aff. detonsa]